ncbi:Isoprenylcysteine carboxylmethyltransferase family protein [Candidatus Electronema halotolerans]|jgi:protein-S-isoprenylcysteine O-methyltransferase Ste14
MNLLELSGSGKKIGLLTLPFALAGLLANIWQPSFFSLGGPPPAVKAAAVLLTAAGVTGWAWSVVLMLTKIPKRELMTTGPYRLAKHPLYTSIALLVLPWAGVLGNSWLGFLLGGIFYAGRRWYAPEEEQLLEQRFGKEWEEYKSSVLLPWL